MLAEAAVEFELKHASAWLGPGQNLYSDKESTTFDAVVDTPEYRRMVSGLPANTVAQIDTLLSAVCAGNQPQEPERHSAHARARRRRRGHL